MSPSPSHPEREKEVCPDCGGRGGWTTIGQHPLGDCSSCGGTGSVEGRLAPPVAGGSESSEQTRWEHDGKLWVKDRDTGDRDIAPGDTLHLMNTDVIIDVEGVAGIVGRGVFKGDEQLLRPAKAFMCSDGVERWETGEVAHVERRGAWFLDADGYPVKCETPTIFEHPILEPLPSPVALPEKGKGDLEALRRELAVAIAETVSEVRRCPDTIWFLSLWDRVTQGYDLPDDLAALSKEKS